MNHETDQSCALPVPIITCVYCGMAYPQGTPAHGAQVLTDHIKICEKHPMWEAEQTIAELQKALGDLIGAHTIEELDEMEQGMNAMKDIVPPDDFATSIAAMRALRKTLKHGTKNHKKD